MVHKKVDVLHYSNSIKTDTIEHESVKTDFLVYKKMNHFYINTAYLCQNNYSDC